MKSYIKKYYSIFPTNDNNPSLSSIIELPENEEKLDALFHEFIDQIQNEVEELETKEGDRNYKFWLFMNLLDNSEIGMLIEDILLENTHSLAIMFQNSYWGPIPENAFNWLAEFPYKTESRILDQLEIIYERAVNGSYFDNEIVLKKIQILTATNKRGLSKEFILRIGEHNNIDAIHKTKLYLLLSLLEEGVSASFWNKKINLENNPYLSVAIMSGLEERTPSDALMQLKEINNRPWVKNEYIEDLLETHLITSVQNFLDDFTMANLTQGEYFLTGLFRNIQKEWLIEILKKVVQDPILENEYPETMKNLINCLKDIHGLAYQYYKDILKNPKIGEMICDLTSNNIEFQKELAHFVYEDFNCGRNDNVLSFQSYIICTLSRSNSIFVETMGQKYNVYVSKIGLQDFRTRKRCEFENLTEAQENLSYNTDNQNKVLELIEEL